MNSCTEQLEIDQAIMGKSLSLLAAPNAELLLASKAANGRQTPRPGRRSKVDNMGQVIWEQRRSPVCNVCLTRSGLQWQALAPCVRQATLPVRDTPPLAFGVYRATAEKG